LFNTHLRFVEGLITAMKQTEDVAHILVMNATHGRSTTTQRHRYHRD
jgi:hypothetical protein